MKAKSRIEILNKVSGVKNSAYPYWKDKAIITPSQALDAMKIAMEMAYNAGSKARWKFGHSIDIQTFEDWLTKIEEEQK
jgi:hypothetical protein